jgi:hypothetical protein
MPVILRTPAEIEQCIKAPAEDALKLKRPLPDGSLTIFARGGEEGPMKKRIGSTKGSAPGKAAENERLKLKAAYFNNISVALVVAGCLIPYLTIIPNIPEIGNHIGMLVNGQISLTLSELMKMSGPVIAFILAMYGANDLRKAANATISRIQD